MESLDWATWYREEEEQERREREEGQENERKRKEEEERKNRIETERERAREGKMRAAAERACKRHRETKSNGIRSPVETRARTRQQANVEPPVRMEVTGIHSQRINGTYVPTVVEDYPWAEGGLVFAKDNAPRPNDGDAEWTGMYCCEITQQWVVCDLMNNSRTVYARSVDFDKVYL